MIIVKAVRTIISWMLLLLLMTLYAIPFIFYLVLPKRWIYDSKLVFSFSDIFYRAVLKASFLPITFRGKEHLPKGPVIFVANHQSSLDIPLLGVLAKGSPHIWLAKKELMKSPILRLVLPRASVLIDMSTPLKGMRSLMQVVNLVYNKQRHVMIFPEGGRYTDGKVHDFFAGFVILARKTGRPIVPVRIFNVHKVYPPGAFLVNILPITVVIGKPFRYQEDDTDESFKNRVYQWFTEQSGE